jgi:CRP/FNR family transcriptional regulator, cyclic AMP receptor protein
MASRPGATSIDPAHLALLRGHPLFGALGADQLNRLCAFARTRSIARGSTIFAKGDAGDALYAICRGSVKITVPSVDGREAIFNVIHAGEVFGEIALLDGRPRTADAVAATDVELIVIERRDFLQLLQEEPNVSRKLIELLCARLRWSSEHFEEVVFLDLAKRLAKTLLRLSGEARVSTRSHRMALTQREIGQLLGASRESVNKQLREWDRAGWIRLEHGRICVLAPDRLARVVDCS